MTAHGTVTIRPKEVIPIYREEWNATVTDYKYDFVNRDFVSRGGNLYQVKIQRPGQFVPAGIDPDSVAGADYWELFNPLKPSATNFLVIIDEDGKPQTLMSGGRIQTKFLNIGSLKMSETRLWGGAELFTGKGLALVNDPDDRKFVVYEDADNYVEMFQREDEWGLKGVVDGNVNSPVFQLGSTNKVGPFEFNASTLVAKSVIPESSYYNQELALTNTGIHFKKGMGSIYQREAYIGTAVNMTGYGSYTMLAIQGGDIWHQGTVREDGGRRGRFYTLDIEMRGVMNVRSGASVNFLAGSGLLLNPLRTFSSYSISRSSNYNFFHVLTGKGQTVTISSGLDIGTAFLITGEADSEFFVQLSGSEKFYRNDKNYSKIKSNYQDYILLIKQLSNRWSVTQLPVNWITWYT